MMSVTLAGAVCLRLLGVVFANLTMFCEHCNLANRTTRLNLSYFPSPAGPAALCGDQPTTTADNQQISVDYLEYASKDAPPFSFHKQSLAYRYSALIRYRMLCTSER